MAKNLVGWGLPGRALLLAGGLLAGTATLAQDVSTGRKPFYCFAFMNPMDGRGFESAYSSIMLGSPDDQEDLQRSFYQAAKAAGTLNDYPDSRRSGCRFFNDADQAAAARDGSIEGFRRNDAHVQKYYAGELHWDGGGLASPLRAKGNKTAAQNKPTNAKVAANTDNSAPPEPSSPKYVEVLDGKGGTIRLSPEVAARNAAAAADFERRLAEHQRKVKEVELANREVARIKAEQDAKAAAVMEAFRRQSEAHAELMRKHQQDAADYQAKLAGSAGVAENLGLRKFQATSPIRATREEAMQALNAPNGQKLTDIQCGEIKGFANEWSCWGFYVQETTRSGVSKQ